MDTSNYDQEDKVWIKNTKTGTVTSAHPTQLSYPVNESEFTLMRNHHHLALRLPATDSSCETQQAHTTEEVNHNTRKNTSTVSPRIPQVTPECNL